MNENCWYKDVCTETCTSACIRYLEMSYLMENSGISIANQYPVTLNPASVDYDAFCQLSNLKDSVLDFVNGGGNLYIASNKTGNGKTSWATKIMLKYFDEVWAGNGFRVRGMFLHVPTLILQLKNFENPLPDDYKHNILDCDLVVWDDIASVEMTNYDLTQMLAYIDARSFNAMSNIYTGNITSRMRLASIVGERLASRIWNKSEVVIFRGEDRRTA